MSDPREDLALLRFRIIGEATIPRLTPAERGHLVRELASQAYEHPDGSSWTYSRGTLDRWVRAYRDHGLDGLRPPPRADLGVVRRHPELLEEACQLRLELPGRSAVQIGAILKVRHGIHLPERTIREHWHRRGLHRAALTGQPRAFGRFEAERPNERWMGDVLVGPFVPFPRGAGSKRAYLFLPVDDFSRLLIHGRWVTDQNTRAGQEVLRAAISQLDQAAHHLVYLANPTVSTRGLYVNIVQALGAVPRGFRAELVAQTQSLLAVEEHERRRVVLVIDLCQLRDYADHDLTFGQRSLVTAGLLLQKSA